MKYCKSCKTEKPREAFSKNKSKKDGLQTYCKSCVYDRYAEKERARAKEWRELNPEKKRESDRKYREANRDRLNEYTKGWRKRNPEKRREQALRNTQERNARKRKLPTEKFSVREIFERDQWVCQLCNEAVDPELNWPHRYSATLDHIVPISDPRPDNPGHVRTNVQLAHYTCNSSKGNSLMED